jgi:hypothetical protein
MPAPEYLKVFARYPGLFTVADDVHFLEMMILSSGAYMKMTG